MLMSIAFEGTRGVKHFFFIKYNIVSYMKALSTNYKPVFIELKNLI